MTAYRGNYNEQNTVWIFHLLQDQERERWLKVMPRDNTPTHPDAVIREGHFPHGYETVFVQVKAWAKSPPSIFNNWPSSVIPSPLPKPRTMKKFIFCAKCAK